MLQLHASSAINMKGPYLTTECICPYCSHNNVLLFIDVYGSPVKAYSLCPHIRAHILDEENLSVFEFDNDQIKPVDNLGVTQQ